jgi:hypothetical protein
LRTFYGSPEVLDHSPRKKLLLAALRVQ